MEFLKKLCSGLIISALLFTSIGTTFAMSEKHTLAKQIVLTKTQLHKLSKGKSYTQTIDKYVENLGDNTAKIEKIHAKVQSALESYKNKNNLSKKEEKIILILGYFSIQLEYKLLLLEEEKENSQEEEMNALVEEVLNSKISDSDKKELEKVIVEMQNSILGNLESSYFELEKYFLDTIEEQTNYQATGDFEMNYDFNLGDYSTAGDISVEDYSIKNSLFDSQITGQVQAIFTAMEEGNEDVNIQVKTLLDMIQKDGRTFAMLKDLEIISTEQEQDIKKFAKRAQELAQENKYFEVTDSNTQDFYNILNSFNSQKAFDDLSNDLQNPFFTSYKKVNNTHYLIPTKYVCDEVKSFQGRFDPFGGKACTDSQYQDLLKEFLSLGEITMTIGNTHTLNYKAHQNNEIEKFEANVEFKNDEILSANFAVIPNQDEYKDEGITVEYVKNSHINFYFAVGDIQTYMDFSSQLDRNNSFESIDFNGETYGYDSVTKWNFALNNNSFDGELVTEFSKNSYDENWKITGSYVSTTIKFLLNGSFDYKNNLDVLQADFRVTDENTEAFKATLDYNDPNLNIEIAAQEEYSGADFVAMFNGVWNQNEHYFSTFDFSSHLKINEFEYDSETWEAKATGNVINVFTADYTLNNNILDGEMNINTFQGEKLATAKTNGNYTGKTGKIDTQITIFNNPLNIYFAQTKKARDSMRIANLNYINAAIEQSYHDYFEYPSYEEFDELIVNTYMGKKLLDPSSGKEINGCKFGYKYYVTDGNNGIKNDAYKLEACLESDVYTTQNDGGTKDNVYEIGFVNEDIQYKDNGYYINNIQNWETVSTQEDSQDEDLVIKINSEFDYLNDKTDLYFFLEVISGEKKYGSLEFKNTGKIKYEKQNIQLPKNIAPIEELMY